MRHGKKINSLGRKAAHRNAMLANMSCSLIEHKRIKTTVAKAKALRVFLEPLLTKSKTDSTHSRRVIFGYLQSKDAINTLYRDIAPKIADRPGGYLRIIRLGNRLGDNAEMCMIELVDFNELMTKDDSTKKTRRSRRGGGAKKATATSKEEKTEAQVETAKVEETPDAEALKEEKPKAKKAEAKKEEKKAPKKEETPKAEKKEENTASKKEEAPKAEKKEEKKTSKKEEAPKAEKKVEKKSDEEE